MEAGDGALPPTASNECYSMKPSQQRHKPSRQTHGHTDRQMDRQTFRQATVDQRFSNTNMMFRDEAALEEETNCVKSATLLLTFFF